MCGCADKGAITVEAAIIGATGAEAAASLSPKKSPNADSTETRTSGGEDTGGGEDVDVCRGGISVAEVVVAKSPKESSAPKSSVLIVVAGVGKLEA